MRTKIFNVFKRNPDCEFTLDEICARFPKLKRSAVSQHLWQLTNKGDRLERIKVKKEPGETYGKHRWKFKESTEYSGVAPFLLGGDRQEVPLTESEKEQMRRSAKKALQINNDRSKIDSDHIGAIVNEYCLMSAPKPELQEYINSRI